MGYWYYYFLPCWVWSFKGVVFLAKACSQLFKLSLSHMMVILLLLTCEHCARLLPTENTASTTTPTTTTTTTTTAPSPLVMLQHTARAGAASSLPSQLTDLLHFINIPRVRDTINQPRHTNTGDTMYTEALKAHPTKSVRIVVGKEEEQAKVERENAADPMTIQGFPVLAVKKDMYQGMMITQDRSRASCTTNIDTKRTKCSVKTQLILRLLCSRKIEWDTWGGWEQPLPLDYCRALYCKCWCTARSRSLTWRRCRSSSLRRSGRTVSTPCWSELRDWTTPSGGCH